MYVMTDDPDEFEAVTEHRTCPFHQMHPAEPFAGCTCSVSFTTKRRAPEDVARIKAKRRREQEDQILAEAEIIRRQRGA